MRIGVRRDPAMTLVFILLTCGLYYLYFIYTVSREMADFQGSADTSPALDVLLCVVTCGIYNIYWDYKTGKRMAEMCLDVGLTPIDNSVLYLILDLLGVGGFASVGIINPMLQQDTLNKIWQAAMAGPGDAPPDQWPPPPSIPPTPRQPRPPL